MGAREMKHMAQLQEWADRISTCRSSGMTVTQWCQEKGISSKTYYRWEREYLTEATKKLSQAQAGRQLVRIEPKHLPSEERCTEKVPGILIRYGYTTIELPSGSAAEAIAEIVSALNRHA